MTYNFKIIRFFFLLKCLLYPLTYLMASEANQGLDIQADSGNTNLLTSVSRLQGNIILKHNGFTITGDSAEIQSENDNNPQLYVINGTPIQFNQVTETSTFSASSNQLVYTPAQELVELQENVSFIQSDQNNRFILKASELQIILSQGRPEQVLSTGNPATFKHEMAEKKIEINAEKITWDSQAQLAVLYNATVKDVKTTFSAEKITYKAETGEISASGDGKTRPSYQFNPEKTKESNINDDS